MAVRPVCLEVDDAVELGEALEFIGDWLVSDRRPSRWDASLGATATTSTSCERTYSDSRSCLASTTGTAPRR